LLFKGPPFKKEKERRDKKKEGVLYSAYSLLSF